VAIIGVFASVGVVFLLSGSIAELTRSDEAKEFPAELIERPIVSERVGKSEDQIEREACFSLKDNEEICGKIVNDAREGYFRIVGEQGDIGYGGINGLVNCSVRFVVDEKEYLWGRDFERLTVKRRIAGRFDKSVSMGCDEMKPDRVRSYPAGERNG
jgi:hypothetical protein